MSRKTIFPLLAVSALALGWTHMACTQTADDQQNLAEFRVALDQMSQGHTQSAQMLLENEARHGQLSPETALVLAHLQDRNNQPQQARATLTKSNQPTSLSRLFLQQLSTPTAKVSTGATPPTSKTKPINTARLIQSDARVAKLERFMFDLVNAERVRQGLSKLAWSDDLADVGRAHSAEMRDKNYFEHQSPTAELHDPLDRYQAGTGTTPRLIAENIYRAWGSSSFLTEDAVRDAHQALLNSPGHRANILLVSATQMGVGITENSKGDIWITQMFSKA